MNNEYIDNLFYDIFIGWFLNSIIKIQKGLDFNRRMSMIVDFFYENGAFLFKFNDLIYKFDNIMLYKDFYYFFINKMQNYGFSLSDNINGDYSKSIIEKGVIEVSIEISGTYHEFMNMFDYENSQRESFFPKDKQKVKE